MRLILSIVGVLCVVFGVVWIAQGMGWLTFTMPGMAPSFMIGDRHWMWYGVGLAAFGLVVLLYARRRDDLRS